MRGFMRAMFGAGIGFMVASLVEPGTQAVQTIVGAALLTIGAHFGWEDE